MGPVKGSFRAAVFTQSGWLDAVNVWRSCSLTLNYNSWIIQKGSVIKTVFCSEPEASEHVVVPAAELSQVRTSNRTKLKTLNRRCFTSGSNQGSESGDRTSWVSPSQRGAWSHSDWLRGKHPQSVCSTCTQLIWVQCSAWLMQTQIQLNSVQTWSIVWPTDRTVTGGFCSCSRQAADPHSNYNKAIKNFI